MDHNRLIDAMIEHNAGMAPMAQHFIKVYAFARLIGEEEGLDPETQATLEAAAIVHDIGIKAAIEKYGDASGPYQEKEGAPLALELLLKLGYSREMAERASTLVGRHHTYTDIDGIDCQILIESDFLVNLCDGGPTSGSAAEVLKNVFRTSSGIRLLKTMFGL